MEKEYDCMPNFMKKFHKELMAREVPIESLKKKDYIREWLNWFDPDVILRCPFAIDQFMQFSKKILIDGFLWTRKNFAELDLGGNTAWFGAALKAMRKMRTVGWNNNIENKLKDKIINEYGRRW